MTMLSNLVMAGIAYRLQQTLERIVNSNPPPVSTKRSRHPLQPHGVPWSWADKPRMSRVMSEKGEIRGTCPHLGLVGRFLWWGGGNYAALPKSGSCCSGKRAGSNIGGAVG